MKPQDKKTPVDHEGKELRNVGIKWGLMGIIIILGVTTLEVHPFTNSERLRVAFRFCENIGMTLTVFGLFNIVLQLPGWRSYFLSRIKDLVVQESYLDMLNVAELKALQTNALKAHFKNENIAREGSFLEFFYSDIYPYIGDPYRERVTLDIRYRKEDDETFVARDTMSYICRISGNSIQPNILWSNDPGEIEEVRELNVTVKYPETHKDRGKTVRLGSIEDFKHVYVDGDGEERVLGSPDEAEDDWNFQGRELQIQLPDELRSVDRLNVIIDAVYTIKTNRFYYWSMSFPTKDFTLALHFPDAYTAQVASFIHNERVGKVTDEPGYYKLLYNAWMIPQSGVAWRFLASPQEKDVSNEISHDDIEAGTPTGPDGDAPGTG